MKKIILFIVLIILIFFVLISISYKNNEKLGESIGVYTHKTTKAGILNKFGKASKIENTGGTEVWRYEDFKITIAGKEKVTTYVVRFNKDEVVSSNYFLMKSNRNRKIGKTAKIDKRFMHSRAFEHSKRGTDYLNARKFQQAIDEFKKSLELFPDYYLTYSNLGYAYLYSGKPS